MTSSKVLALAALVCCTALPELHATSLTSVAKILAKAAAKLPNKRVAVVAFPYHDGYTSTGSTVVSERLTTLLVGRKGVEVIERSLLAPVLAEMKLEESGVTDPARAQKLGKMLNVGAVVTGTLIDLSDDETEVNARLIQTETGEILAAATTTVDRTWLDSPRAPIVTTTDDDSNEPVHMSALIPTHPIHRHHKPVAPLYNALYSSGPSGDAVSPLPSTSATSMPDTPPPPSR